jgi:hypothetical protein
LTCHKSVLATVPYFKTAFECGMRESDSTFLELPAPPNTTESALKAFIKFVYLRDPDVLNSSGIECLLTELLYLADFYGFIEFMDAIAAWIVGKPYLISDANSLALLKLLEPLEFPNRKRLETRLVDYIVLNYVRIAKTQEFYNELAGTDVYDLIIDSVANGKRNIQP